MSLAFHWRREVRDCRPRLHAGAADDQAVGRKPTTFSPRSPGRYRYKKCRLKGASVGELDLESATHRVDDSDARGGRNVDGLGGGEYPSAHRKSEPSHLAPCGSYPDRPDRGGRTASRGATWRGGRALGGGILVAWRAQLAERCNPLLRRFDEHTRRFGADAGAPLAADGRTRGDGRYAAVRYQYRLYVRDDAGLLATHDPWPPSLITIANTRHRLSRFRLSSRTRILCISSDLT